MKYLAAEFVAQLSKFAFQVSGWTHEFDGLF